MANKILVAVGGVVAVGVVGVLGVAATKPDVIHVHRSTVMKAAPAQVFPYANDFQKFVSWMPWGDLDPNPVIEYSSPPSGVGAWYTWKGNKDVGQGRMDLTSASPDKVVHRLTFVEPFESAADTAIVMADRGDGTVEVTWTYDQQAGFMDKVMTVFMDMDAMLGPDYEKGLARLKTRVEADAAATAL